MSKIYIGQSQDIHSRYSRHIREMTKNTHYNYKIQEAFNKYGVPELDIIEACQVSELTSKEMFWIDEFDSCKNGLNIRDKDDSALRGPNANSAKYTRKQIIQVFELLIANTPITRKEISQATGVPVGNINCIARGASHLWLKTEFPDEYKVLESYKHKSVGLSQSSIIKNGKTYSLVDSKGVVYSNITNLKRFCNEKDIPYDQIWRLCAGKAKSAHGWKVLQN
jgi:group I intron endonuclease